MIMMLTIGFHSKPAVWPRVARVERQ